LRLIIIVNSTSLDAEKALACLGLLYAVSNSLKAYGLLNAYAKDVQAVLYVRIIPALNSVLENE
jgi:hypothetical protein